MKLLTIVTLVALCSLDAYSQSVSGIQATDKSGKPVPVRIPAISVGDLQQFFVTGKIKEITENAVVITGQINSTFEVAASTKIVDVTAGVIWPDFRKTLKVGDVVTVSGRGSSSDFLAGGTKPKYTATSVRKGYMVNDASGVLKDELGNIIKDTFK